MLQERLSLQTMVNNDSYSKRVAMHGAESQTTHQYRSLIHSFGTLGNPFTRGGDTHRFSSSFSNSVLAVTLVNEITKDNLFGGVHAS